MRNEVERNRNIMQDEKKRRGKVGFRMGYTENLGDFRSLKFEFVVEDVQAEDGEGYMEVLEEVYENVSERLSLEIARAQGLKRGKSK